MIALTVVLGLVFFGGLALLAYGMFAPKKATPVAAAPNPDRDLVAEPAVPDEWARGALAEFDAMSDAARCDFIFALGALPDERTSRILLHALDDRSEAVALAAAHVLLRSGRADDVRRRAAGADPDRREAVLQFLSVMA